MRCKTTVVYLIIFFFALCLCMSLYTVGGQVQILAIMLSAGGLKIQSNP